MVCLNGLNGVGIGCFLGERDGNSVEIVKIGGNVVVVWVFDGVDEII